MICAFPSFYIYLLLVFRAVMVVSLLLAYVWPFWISNVTIYIGFTALSFNGYIILSSTSAEWFSSNTFNLIIRITGFKYSFLIFKINSILCLLIPSFLPYFELIIFISILSIWYLVRHLNTILLVIFLWINIHIIIALLFYTVK